MSTAVHVDRRSPEYLTHAMGISYEVPNQVLETMPQPMVSVRTVTFRHAAYLRQCIEGVLMQRTTFPVEYVIGEDFSDDDTRAIAFAYAAKYPDRIRLITADENVGMRANGHRIREACRGKYHAICEGDDHWTDPLKLQKQVDALEADPQAVGCFTNATVEGPGESGPYLGGRFGHVPKGPIGLRSYIEKGQTIPVCTMLFRADAMHPLPVQLSRAPAGDMILFAHLLRMGHFIYLPEATAVYRVHPGGVFSMRSIRHRLETRIKLVDLVEEMYPERGFDVEPRRVKLMLEMWSKAIEAGELDVARDAWRMIKPRRKAAGWSFTTLLRNWAKAWMPWADRSYTALFAR